MKQLCILLLFILLAGIMAACTPSQEKSVKEEKETFLDRKVHIEKELITDIPQVT